VIGRIPPRSLGNAYLEGPSRNLVVLCQDWARGSHKLLRSSFLAIACFCEFYTPWSTSVLEFCGYLTCQLDFFFVYWSSIPVLQRPFLPERIRMPQRAINIESASYANYNLPFPQVLALWLRLLRMFD
jgi:hypothetical protein